MPDKSPPENQKPGPSVRTIPAGDNLERLVCPDCNYIAYQNPKIIAGAVCVWEDKVLLCRRAIDPRRGFWTIPAGYLELGETAAEGAAREVVEEAGAKIQIGGLMGIYEIPRISQVYFIYRATMLSSELDPGPESEAAALYEWAEIPWDDLAFPSSRWALREYPTAEGILHYSADHSERP